MKILLVSSIGIVGGGEHNLRLLARQLAKVHSVTMVIPKTMVEFYKTDEYDVIPYAFPSRTWLKGYYVCSADQYLTDLAAEFDICHAYCINSLPLLRFVEKSKIVWTCHGHWEVTSQRKAKKIEDRVGQILFVSRSVRENIHTVHDLVGDVVYIGSELEASPVSGTIDEKYPLNIICIGRFQQIKGQDLLIRSLMQKSFRLPCNIHFMGQHGSSVIERLFFRYCQILAQLCIIYNSNCTITFHGYCDNPFSRVNRKNSIVVVPSRYESFSMVTVEALANGLPVVVPEFSGAAEIIQNDNLGARFESGNVHSLSKILLNVERLLSLPRASLLKRASRFHVSCQTKQVIDAYEALIAKG